LGYRSEKPEIGDTMLAEISYFSSGLAGALVAYIALYRQSRIEHVFEKIWDRRYNTSKALMPLIFDLVFFLTSRLGICMGLLACLRRRLKLQ
jgi:hypothetical protein